MFPFINPIAFPPFNPFGPFPFTRRVRVPRLDVRGIPEICSTGIQENVAASGTVDYGINPCIWRQLPCQSIILWKVRHSATAANAGLPATVAIPTNSSSTTVNSPASNPGVSKVPVVDNHSNQITAGDVVPTGSYTEHLVYIDKASGTFRLLGVNTTAAAPAA